MRPAKSLQGSAGALDPCAQKSGVKSSEVFIAKEQLRCEMMI